MLTAEQSAQLALQTIAKLLAYIARNQVIIDDELEVLFKEIEDIFPSEPGAAAEARQLILERARRIVEGRSRPS